MAQLYFDDKTYNINGTEDQNSPYTALFTLNFGEIKTFDAIGYVSGNPDGFPQAQDVYVSNDGVNWTKVPSACYNSANRSLVSLNKANRQKSNDPWNNNTPANEFLFNMNGVSGKYIRIGIIKGGNVAFHGINTRELVVFGK